MVLNEQFEFSSMRELFAVSRHNWELKNSFQRWCYLYSMGRAANEIVNHRLFRERQTLAWPDFVPILYTTVYFILVLYTISYYIIAGESFKCLSCTCLLVGPGFGVCNNLSEN